MAARASKRRRLASATRDTMRLSLQRSGAPDFEEIYAAKHRTSIDAEPVKLPIKTAGVLLRPTTLDHPDEGKGAEKLQGGESNVGIQLQSLDTLTTQIISDLKPHANGTEQQLVNAAKEELARIAATLNEEPENSPAAFGSLARISQTPSPVVRKLALVTQMTVYKDVIPGYRIRLAGSDTKEKVSKQVRKVRIYEESLVRGYEAFVKNLAECALLDPVTFGGLPDVAVTCACTLITSVPHFNFRGELLRLIVRKLSGSPNNQGFSKCLNALRIVFQEDETGETSLEAVSLLSTMIRARHFQVDESVINLFLHLRLLTEYSPGSHADSLDKRTKFRRSRRSAKEQHLLSKDMALVGGQMDSEQRDHCQSEALKLVFVTYLRVLKLGRPRLMAAVLEGLAKYAHLINTEFFGDLIETMRELVKDAWGAKNPINHVPADVPDDEDDIVVTRNASTIRETLLCLVTALSLLEGRDAARARHDPQLDIPFFQNHLYRTLLPLALNPNIEMNEIRKSLQYTSPSCSGVKVPDGSDKLQSTVALLLRCVTSVLLPRFNMRAVPATRVAAFTKQILTSSLQLPEKSARALLVLLCEVAKTHGQNLASLWNTEERLVDGRFLASTDDPEASNPFATTVWECELLKKHFCPQVRHGVGALEVAIISASKAV